MRRIFIDTSVVLTILLDQDKNGNLIKITNGAHLYGHELLITECYSVAKRENIPFSIISAQLNT